MAALRHYRRAIERAEQKALDYANTYEIKEQDVQKLLADNYKKPINHNTT